MDNDENFPCPCGHKDQTYDLCCKPVHYSKPLGSAASSCEQLMRSRYSAYVLGLADYLVETTHPKASGKGLKESILQSMQGTKWLGLSILRTQLGGPDDKIGKVEFVAKLSEERKNAKPRVGSLHELSRFSRYEGRWVYVDGDTF